MEKSIIETKSGNGKICLSTDLSTSSRGQTLLSLRAGHGVNKKTNSTFIPFNEGESEEQAGGACARRPVSNETGLGKTFTFKSSTHGPLKTNYGKLAFTLVELIVVIVIVGVLATIAFLSFRDYPKQARDAVRLTNIKSIYQGLDIYYSQNGDLPIPDNKIDIKMGSVVVGHQGNISEEILNKINFNGEGKDPQTKKHYTYYVTPDLQYGQIMGTLEIGKKNKIIGKRLGIITDQNNTPIQDIPTIQGSGSLDILNTTTVYKAHITEDKQITGPGQVLKVASPTYNCSRLSQILGPIKGYYDINRDGTNRRVFCDSSFADKEFYDFVVGGDMEYETGNFTVGGIDEFEESVGNKSPSMSVERVSGINNTPSGNHSLKIHGINTYTPNYYTYIQPGKRYRLSGCFKGEFTSSMASLLYFGFKEFDKEFRYIYPLNAKITIGTETTLAQAVSENDTVLQFYCDTNIYNNWNNATRRFSVVAFDIDDSGAYNDLPNFNISNSIHSSDATPETGFVTKSGNICSLTFKNGQTVGKNYSAGIKIRFHDGGDGSSYNYRGASAINLNSSPYNNGNFHCFSGEVDGMSPHGISFDKFRKGTKFAQVVILPNFLCHGTRGVDYTCLNPNSTIYVDDLKLEVID